MRAYLIDPFARAVSVVDYDGDFRSIHRLIDADLFDAVTLDDQGTTLFVDDEGLFREGQQFFRHVGYPQPLAGKALVLGTDRQGRSVAPKVGFDALASAVSWVAPAMIAGELFWVEV